MLVWEERRTERTSCLCEHELGLLEDGANVVARSQLVHDRQEIVKSSIVLVGEPRRDWDGVIRLEHVAEWTVVDDDGMIETTTQMCEVLRNPKTL